MAALFGVCMAETETPNLRSPTDDIFFKYIVLPISFLFDIASVELPPSISNHIYLYIYIIIFQIDLFILTSGRVLANIYIYIYQKINHLHSLIAHDESSAGLHI